MHIFSPALSHLLHFSLSHETMHGQNIQYAQNLCAPAASGLL